MNNIDKDVAAMIASLKKYDKLTESVAPVLGMRTLGEAGKPEWLEDAEKKAEKKEGKADKKEEVKEEEEKNPWRDLAKKEDKKGKVTKTATGLKHEKNYDAKEDKKDDEELDESASADQDVLTWMKRFANLGNMKGYGR
jgi:hypothetical protein